MAEEGVLRDQMSRGARAKALLQNDLLVEAFEKIEAHLVSSWDETHSEESQRREDAWRSLKLLKNLKRELSLIVTTGNAASKQLLEIRKPTIVERILQQ